MSESLQAVMVLFLFIFCGWVGVRSLLNQEMMVGLNRFVYYFAVPALLFDAASKLSLNQLLAPLPLSAFFFSALATGLITVAGSRALFHCKSGSQLTARALNTTFANYAYMGIPVVSSLLGAEGYPAIITLILMGNLVLIGGAQILLLGFEPDSKEGNIWQQCFAILDQSLLRSPIFLSAIFGLMFSAAGLTLPEVPQQFLTGLGAVTVPLALFCLGAGLQFRVTGGRPLEFGWLILLKLVVHPLMTLLAIWLLGVNDPVWLTALVMMTALPTGALAYVVTSHHGVFERETALIVTLTTLLSVISLSVWIQVIS